MQIEDYISKKDSKLTGQRKHIRDFRIFDFNYMPEKPLMREEAKPIIDALLRYKHSGIANHILVTGPRGTGKTILMKHLMKLFSEKHHMRSKYVNCRTHNTSYKIVAEMLDLKPRGITINELWGRFRDAYPDEMVIVLDEVDLISDRDKQMEILYLISRSPENYMTILLSNNPRFLGHLDESSRSTLQPEIIHFSNYTPVQIENILLQRARTGLHTIPKRLIAHIAALTARNTQSDARVAIKTLYYAIIEPEIPLEDNFERARKNICIDVIKDLNEKTLLILKGAVDTPDKFVKSAYNHYKKLSMQYGVEAFSYVYFYSTLSYLQSLGLIMLISTKVNRTYTNRIQILFDTAILEKIFRFRFE